MEFSTPHGVAPDGILLCGTASTISLTALRSC